MNWSILGWMPKGEQALEEVRELLRDRGPGVALTGAGISAECGIPPFRGPGGLWEKYPPEEYATDGAFRRDPAKVWTMLREVLRAAGKARPGPGHRALADMERCGSLLGVITQNVDGLHQMAGSRRVVELHGSGRRLSCSVCGAELSTAAVDLDRLPPACGACNGVLRPDVVLFGEALPPGELERAGAWVEQATLVLVVGTSCQVWPAAGLPRLARSRGSLLVEINPAETALTPEVDVHLAGPAGEVLPRLME